MRAFLRIFLIAIIVVLILVIGFLSLPFISGFLSTKDSSLPQLQSDSIQEGERVDLGLSGSNILFYERFIVPRDYDDSSTENAEDRYLIVTDGSEVGCEYDECAYIAEVGRSIDAARKILGEGDIVSVEVLEYDGLIILSSIPGDARFVDIFDLEGNPVLSRNEINAAIDDHNTTVPEHLHIGRMIDFLHYRQEQDSEGLPLRRVVWLRAASFVDKGGQDPQAHLIKIDLDNRSIREAVALCSYGVDFPYCYYEEQEG